MLDTVNWVLPLLALLAEGLLDWCVNCCPSFAATEGRMLRELHHERSFSVEFSEPDDGQSPKGFPGRGSNEGIPVNSL